MSYKTNKIAFQGDIGANSDMACRDMFPDMEPMPCSTFEDAFNAVTGGEADLGMIPIENTIAGRVADIHHLLPDSALYIVGEHFERVRHQLMAPPGATLEGLETVYSHTQALGQCRHAIRDFGLKPVPEADTAGSARIVAEAGDKTRAAIASLRRPRNQASASLAPSSAPSGGGPIGWSASRSDRAARSRKSAGRETAAAAATGWKPARRGCESESVARSAARGDGKQTTTCVHSMPVQRHAVEQSPHLASTIFGTSGLSICTR